MKNLLFILLTFVFLSGCSTDFEVTAPYKETMVIYGLLNPNDHVQYIRISKAFLGEGNALIMAQQHDSLYYDTLSVKMERYLNGSLMESHALVRVDSIPKDSGTFSYPSQVYYAYTDSIYDDRSTYNLIAKNTKSGHISTSSTHVIGNFTINAPTNNKKIDFTSPPDFYQFEIITPDYGKAYAFEMKIKYTEINTTNNDSIQKSINWNLDQQVTDQSSKLLDFTFKKSQFFQFIAANVTKASNKKYTFNGIDVYIIGGSDDLYTYINVTNPSYGIVQDKPVYSNIVNGVGLFATRNVRMRHIILDPNTIAYLNGLYN